MKLGIYGDLHLTKNMRTLQSIWDETSIKSINHMYDKFDEMDVESAICLGDFFDAPRIEAKSMNLVIPILDMINSRTYPTYILLGNHEAESSESNILDFLNTYDNIIPITHTMCVESMLFIPYYDDPILYDMKGKIVFTHHDIYGSALASGKTTAFFGLDPSIFKDAKIVMNGHVHTKSKPAPNLINTGSLLVSQQGELRVGDRPSYYILDTKTMILDKYDNMDSMIFLTIEKDEVSKVAKYDSKSLVLKVEYDGEIPDLWIETVHTSWRKKISSIDSQGEIVSNRNFDMKNYLVEYIKKDQDVPEDKKEDYITTGLEMMD